jgi:hypothetical protein
MTQEKISHQQLNKVNNETVGILLQTTGYSIYRLVRDSSNLEHWILGISGAVLLLAVMRFQRAAERFFKDGHDSNSFFDRLVTHSILVGGLGVYVLYMFFYKGLYQFYDHFSGLPWWGILFRVYVVGTIYKLAMCIIPIQSVASRPFQRVPQ